MEDFYDIHPRKRRVLIKKEARNVLFHDWILRILAFVITGGCCLGIMQFGTALSLVLDGVTHNIKFSLLVYFLYILLSLCVVVPICYGLVYSYIS